MLVGRSGARLCQQRHPVPQSLDISFDRGEGGAEVVGDTRYQIGAGPLIGRGLLPLGQQVLLHLVKGGTHRGELILSAIVHRLGEVPLLHTTGSPGEGVHRCQQPSDLPAGKQQIERHDNDNGSHSAKDHGKDGNLSRGPLAAQKHGHGGGGD